MHVFCIKLINRKDILEILNFGFMSDFKINIGIYSIVKLKDL